MKRILLIAVVAFGLGGCAQIQKAADVVVAVTKSYTNPVTRADLDAAEGGVQLVFTGLNTYKRACVQGIADKNCRENIKAIQVYTRKVPPILKNLRAFVDSGDQINATTAYNTLMNLIRDVRSEAYIRNMKIGA
jgi:hypothetical protein